MLIFFICPSFFIAFSNNFYQQSKCMCDYRLVFTSWGYNTHTHSHRKVRTRKYLYGFHFNSFHFIWFCFAPLLPLNNLVSSLDCNDRINCSIELTKKNNQTKPHRSTTFHLPLSTFHFVPSFQRIKYIIIQWGLKNE